jgi:hypothetical protein
MEPLDNKQTFGENYKRANLREVRRAKREHLYQYYEYFASLNRSVNPESLNADTSRGSAQRMQSIEREFDRRSKFWATIIGLVAAIGTAASAAVGIAQFLDYKHQPTTQKPAQAQQAATPQSPAASESPTATPETSPTDN